MSIQHSNNHSLIYLPTNQTIKFRMSCDEFGIKFYHEIDHIIYSIYHGNDEDVATIKTQEHLSKINIEIEPKDIVFYWDELF